LVTSPRTGKIAYVVIARGGVFGIGQRHVPVSWEDLKSAPNMHFLVLDLAGAIMASAPKFDDSEFKRPTDFAQKSEEANAYWTSHLADKGTD
jgi:hypothetical protein